MATLEDRVTTVEAQTARLIVAIEAMQKDIAAIRADMANMATRADVAALRTELKAEIGALSVRMDRLFIWLAGTQVATLLAVIGLLAGVLYRGPR